MVMLPPLEHTLPYWWYEMREHALMHGIYKYRSLKHLIFPPLPRPEYLREGVLLILEPGLKIDTKKDMEQALKHENTLLIIDPNKLSNQEISTLAQLLK